jgi:glucose-1-phosphate adenylyltransferase
MGADFKETPEMRKENKKLGHPNVGIGKDAIIESAIVDKNARIGTKVHIRNVADRKDADNENWFAREGLVVIPKDAIIPDGTVI